MLGESNFNFRYVRLWYLHIPREKWLNYLQTVETLIRRRVLWGLIWVCTVCHLPFYGSPDCNGLMPLPGSGGEHIVSLFSYICPSISVSVHQWLSWIRRPTGDQEVTGSTPAEVGNILSWRLIMKYFLCSFSPFRWFRWFKKGLCPFLAKECAQYWVNHLKD